MGRRKYNSGIYGQICFTISLLRIFLTSSLRVIGGKLQEIDGCVRAAGALSQGQEHAMDRDVTDRLKAGMEADFLPDPSPDTLSQIDRRMANAAEYVAYHLGQIDKKLDRLITLLENAAREKSEQPSAAQ
jgi:hypothetical protein